jgi:hypothetical protein
VSFSRTKLVKEAVFAEMQTLIPGGATVATSLTAKTLPHSISAVDPNVLPCPLCRLAAASNVTTKEAYQTLQALGMAKAQTRFPTL